MPEKEKILENVKKLKNEILDFLVEKVVEKPTKCLKILVPSEDGILHKLLFFEPEVSEFNKENLLILTSYFDGSEEADGLIQWKLPTVLKIFESVTRECAVKK